MKEPPKFIKDFPRFAPNASLKHTAKGKHELESLPNHQMLTDQCLPIQRIIQENLTLKMAVELCHPRQNQRA